MVQSARHAQLASAQPKQLYRFVRAVQRSGSDASTSGRQLSMTPEHLFNFVQALNATILRKTALYLLGQDPTKSSYKRKRKRAAYDNQYLNKLL